MDQHQTVSREQWLAARRALLADEKEFTRWREQLSARRRELPWLRVEQNYTFDGPSGKRTLPELFAGRSQLVVYHFMFGPEASAGCRGCSFWADSFDGSTAHLAQRDVTLVAVSRGPLPKLQAFAKRMGWSFPWFSSTDSAFNFDYGVSFDESAHEKSYNYGSQKPQGSEMPGISVFVRAQNGDVFHTYSCYARGIDMMNVTYQYLDLVPKGRDEAALSSPTAWLRHHDEY
jgi:predicted dithiol-disulfide oxidoreductase (DUF899 family)